MTKFSGQRLSISGILLRWLPFPNTKVWRVSVYRNSLSARSASDVMLYRKCCRASCVGRKKLILERVSVLRSNLRRPEKISRKELCQPRIHHYYKLNDSEIVDRYWGVANSR
jgi:hypothetical protein